MARHVGTGNAELDHPRHPQFERCRRRGSRQTALVSDWREVWRNARPRGRCLRPERRDTPRSGWRKAVLPSIPAGVPAGCPPRGLLHQAGGRADPGLLEISHQIVAPAILEKVRVGGHRAVWCQRLRIEEMRFQPCFRAAGPDVCQVRSLPAVAYQHGFAPQAPPSRIAGWPPDSFIRRARREYCEWQWMQPSAMIDPPAAFHRRRWRADFSVPWASTAMPCHHAHGQGRTPVPAV